MLVRVTDLPLDVNEAISAVTLTFLASGCIAADQAESTTPTRGPTGPF